MIQSWMTYFEGEAPPAELPFYKLEKIGIQLAGWKSRMKAHVDLDPALLIQEGFEMDDRLIAWAAAMKRIGGMMHFDVVRDDSADPVEVWASTYHLQTSPYGAGAWAQCRMYRLAISRELTHQLWLAGHTLDSPIQRRVADVRRQMIDEICFSTPQRLGYGTTTGSPDSKLKMSK